MLSAGLRLPAALSLTALRPLPQVSVLQFSLQWRDPSSLLSNMPVGIYGLVHMCACVCMVSVGLSVLF